MKQFQNITILFIIILFSSCSSSKNSSSLRTGTIRIVSKEDDIFTNAPLRSYMKSGKTPTIVLRVPKQVDEILDENKYSKSQVYYTIEKELARAGFKVRDRALFQRTLDDQKGPTDYTKINELTNTDLIIELINYEKLNYTTNTYVTRKGKSRTIDGIFSIPGIKVEFKIIMVKENDFVGNYKFYYSPCNKGCKYKFDNQGNIYLPRSRSKVTPSNELVSSEDLQDFIKSCVEKLIKELNK